MTFITSSSFGWSKTKEKSRSSRGFELVSSGCHSATIAATTVARWRSTPNDTGPTHKADTLWRRHRKNWEGPFWQCSLLYRDQVFEYGRIIWILCLISSYLNTARLSKSILTKNFSPNIGHIIFFNINDSDEFFSSDINELKTREIEDYFWCE